MHNALLFNGITIFAASLAAFLLRGQQRRRELDEAQQSKLMPSGIQSTDLEMHVRRGSVNNRDTDGKQDAVVSVVSAVHA
jgi:hypothetical protein